MTLEEAVSHLPQLIREAHSGQDVILLQDQRPVAKLIPIGDDAPSASEIAQIAMAGGAFDWLADEPDLYDDTCGEAISRH